MVNFMSDSIKVDERLQHIAFIMDGNGRWAERRGMPRRYGHRYGAEAFKKIVRYCGEIGIKYVTVYAFSTENWSRPEDEVAQLMKLLLQYIESAIRELDENKIRFIFLGNKEKLSPELRERMNELEMLSEKYSLTLNIALNYGGRDEIVYACNTLIKEGKEEITDMDMALFMAKYYDVYGTVPEIPEDGTLPDIPDLPGLGDGDGDDIPEIPDGVEIPDDVEIPGDLEIPQAA